MEPRIIRDNTTLFASYNELQSGDIVVGRVRLKPGEEHLLFDLDSRGIILIPSASAQLCSRSKVYQTRLLGSFMVPGTRAVYDIHDVMELVSAYGRQGVGRVVCKLDRANAGLGILLYSSIEDVYNQAILGTLPFPFAVQPFVEKARDVRVVLLGDYVEAYQRINTDNFRNNLHCGGQGKSWQLSSEQLNLCWQVMERAGFIYGHIDLLLRPDDKVFLNEINLRGGLRGAKIGQQEYLEAVASLHNQLLSELHSNSVD